MRKSLALLVACALIAPSATFAETAESHIQWVNEFSDDIFARAAAEKKLVILDLEAVWCHWCHVMHKETYSNPEVQQLIGKNFIALRVDQDSRPDLSTRYNDFGWPATIILNAKGEDLAKRSGYIEPNKMTQLLKDVVAHPVPQAEEVEESTEPTGNGFLSQEIRTALIKNVESSFDREKGGLSFPHRFLNGDVLEIALREANNGNRIYEDWATLTLNENRKLLDPAWGGVYQYSTDYGWENAHFEKIVSSQAANIRSYAFAYALRKDAKDLASIENLRMFLKNFLTSPEGAFYTSQDADVVRGEHSEEFFKLDDAKRRAIGIPVIDKHVYAHENGLLIEALAVAYAATGKDEYLLDAVSAAKWITTNRGLPGGGFRHDEVDKSGPFLRDSLSMGRAFLALYAATADRQWLTKATAAADFITANFVSEGKKGFFSFAPKNAGILKPVRLQEENIPAVRFLNLLGQYSGNAKYADAARSALEYLSSPRVATEYRIQPGIVMAEAEVLAAPLHITILGKKGDAAAVALYKAGLAVPNTYKRVEWFDRTEGPLPNADVEYPVLDKPAAFLCTGKRCSFPMATTEAFEKQIAKLKKPAKP